MMMMEVEGHLEPLEVQQEAQDYGFEEEEYEEYEGIDALDAFEDFNIRAEKHVESLLKATEDKLYSQEIDDTSQEKEEEVDQSWRHPVSIEYLRATQPPNFQDWQNSFPYLYIKGHRLIDQGYEENIPNNNRQAKYPTHCIELQESTEVLKGEILRQISSSLTTNDITVVDEGLCIQGTSCPTYYFEDIVDTAAVDDDKSSCAYSPQEEMIMIDGCMEEIILADNGTTTTTTTTSSSCVDAALSACESPRSTKVEEIIDELTKELMKSLVVPCLQKIGHEIFLSHQRIQANTRPKTIGTTLQKALDSMKQETQTEEKDTKASKPVRPYFCRSGRKLLHLEPVLLLRATRAPKAVAESESESRSSPRISLRTMLFTGTKQHESHHRRRHHQNKKTIESDVVVGINNNSESDVKKKVNEQRTCSTLPLIKTSKPKVKRQQQQHTKQAEQVEKQEEILPAPAPASNPPKSPYHALPYRYTFQKTR